MLAICKEYYTENSYSGSDWNFERTTKYIFKNKQEYLEAGYFVHYVKKENDLEEKKYVIELPSSYGCPMKCGFCASSQIANIRKLSINEICEMFTLIYQRNKLKEKEIVLVSMMGIGDLHFTLDVVGEAMKKIAKSNENVLFSVSSCYWNESMMKEVEQLAQTIRFRTIQMTYVTHDDRKLESIIKYFKKIPYGVEEAIRVIRKTNRLIKINYILMKGINDSKDDFDAFISIFEEVKNKIIVRISKINLTDSCKRNSIISSPIEKMEEFKQQLMENGYNAYLFYSYVNDGMNCGQLITEKFMCNLMEE